MVTRRLYKKVLLRAAGEIVEVLERFSGKKVLNRDAIGRFIDFFLRGAREDEKNFSTFPLKVDGVVNGACHLILEKWPLTLTLRSNPGLFNLVALEGAYEERRSSHPHVRIQFKETGYDEMKRELIVKLRQPSAPDETR